MRSESTPSSRAKLHRIPWATLLASVLAIAAWFWPGSFDALAYQRDRILAGEVWRIITCHWVHFSGSHLFWNLVVLVPTGVWLELRAAAVLRWTLALAPLAVGAGLLIFQPSLSIYAGISGLASGLLVALAVHGLRTERTKRLGWLALLLLIVAKLALDFSSARPLNPDLAARGIHSVPLAHALGALAGALSALASIRDH
jgi:rhomboid family GlyGly-CTERM serine protease